MQRVFVQRIRVMAKVCCVLTGLPLVLRAFPAWPPESLHVRQVWQGLAVPMCVTDSRAGFLTLALLTFGTFAHYFESGTSEPTSWV